MSQNKYPLLLPMIFVALVAGCFSDTETVTFPDNNRADTDFDAGHDATPAEDTDTDLTTPDAALVPDADTTPDSGPPPTCETDDDCTAPPGSEATCREGTCEYACNEGFVNLDSSTVTGCECEITAADDVPDGTDTNCDGVDGIAEQNVYVTTGGSDDAAGITPDAAFATLSKAIEFAATEGRTTILVGAGEYHENVVLKSGVHLYGGYEADWSLGDGRTVLIADATETDKNIATLTASGIDEDTILSGFVIRGPDNSATAGASTYAMRVLESPEEKLQLVNVQIVAGKAGDGVDGVDGGAAGTGEGGFVGSNRNPGDGGGSECGATGGAGGAPLACVAGEGQSGGNGKAGINIFRQGGAGGQGGANQCGDVCSFGANNNGQSGDPGGHGDNGVNGKTSENPLGSFNEGLWIPAASEPATDGQTGTGGGGGGGGGSFVCSPGSSDGGAGGGGGAGGCNGRAGTHGQAGGSAFALVLVNSAVSLVDVELLLGAAGDGGNGGAGSDGRPGLDGGDGQARSSDFVYASRGSGGDGGKGGDGGHGGGGAGGCGGASVGIALVGTSADPENVNYVSGDAGIAGIGGAGGASSGNAGDAGCDGVLINMATY